MQVKVGIAQIPNTIDLDANFAALESLLKQFEKHEVSLVLFPECALSGFSAKIQECTRDRLSAYVDRVQAWTDQHRIEVALPTAIIEQGHVFNSGFWFKPGEVQQFYKMGLTGSEKKFFAVPDGPTKKVFEVSGIKFGLLICLEAQHGAWDYFQKGDVDIILWPGYWGWSPESTWGSDLEPNLPNLIYKNQTQWKCPILQANFAVNELEGHFGSGPEGLSCVIDFDNSVAFRGAHKKSQGMIVTLQKTDQGFKVFECKPLLGGQS